MKKTILIIMVILLSGQSILAQWSLQNSGTTNNLTSVNFINANVGWAVGTSGKIIYTANGGTNWGTQISGVASQLNSVSFSGSLNGLIAGSSGKILMTSDGGLIWQSMNSGTAVDLFGVFSISTTTAVAVGDNGKIIKTIDGGLTWTSKVSGTTDILWSVFFVDANTGWAVGGHFANGTSKILKTINGGESWTAQTSPTTLWLYSVSFSDSQNGWAVGPNGTIVATTNGGTNWVLQPSGEINEWFYGCGAASGSNVWVGGSGGLIKATTNGGTNWSAQTSGITDALRSFSFVNTTTGWAVGDAGKVLKYTPVPSGTVTVTSPNGGESWKVGSSQNITWTSSSVTNVKLEYSANNGTNWTQIVASTPAAAGTYAWTIPNSNSTQALVRVSDAADNTIKDQSNAVFTIYTPTITVISPNGGEKWISGTSKKIEWNSSNVTNVKIEYSSDNGVNWNLIANNISAYLNGYNWVVSQEPSVNYLVRITDAVDALVSDISNNKFTVPSLKLFTPAGGERWLVNTWQIINWTSVGVQNVVLRYRNSQMALNTWTSVSWVAASSGLFQWKIPNDVSENTVFQIVDADEPSLFSESPPFAIVTPTVTLTSPNGGENWKIGTTQNITWTSSNVTNIKLEYSINNGTSWVQIVGSTPANTGIYSWTIPNSSTSSAIVRITDTSDNTVKDQSNSVFRIYNQTVSVLFPNGGENWRAGSTQTITWIATNIPNVKIEYSINNGTNWTQIAASVASNISGLANYYSWSVPSVNTTQALVRISDITDNTIVDQSNAVFTTYIPTLGLTSPNGGENWKGGTIQNITWTSNNVTNVKLEYSINNGTNWTQIIASTAANTGIYSWAIPNSITTQALLRVTDTSDNTLKDQSNAVFAIFTPIVTVTSPNGGENWKVGTNQYITWSSSNVTRVKLEYSINNGSNWTQIVASTAASAGSYNWTVTNSTTSQALVRITDTSDNTVTDQSNVVFTIYQPTITITSPNGGEDWLYDTSHNITWNTNLTGNLQLLLTADDGGHWIPITTVAANAGSYNWRVTNNISQRCKIKLLSADNTVSDESDSIFIINKFNLLYPDAVVILPEGSNNNIMWNYAYKTFDNVKIEYTTNNGLIWNTITNSTPLSAEYFPWKVPKTPSEQCRVKISNSENPFYSDSSSHFFYITSMFYLAVTSPYGGQNWASGSIHSINWDSRNIAHVKLEFTTDNGINWTQIIASRSAALGNYEWRIPNVSSTNCKIRISDVDDATLNDVSDGTFTIYQPTLTLTSPNGGENLLSGTTHLIKWANELISNVKIEYTTNNGTSWIVIVNNYSASLHEYSWTVPDINTTSCKIRISDQSDASINDQSNAVFSIINRGIIVINPDGGEKWQTGKVKEIKWFSSNVQNVKISYSIDDGLSWTPISLSTQASLRSFLWSVVDNPSTKFRIKIKDASSATEAISNAISTIAKLELIQPNGGEYCSAGRNYKIKWLSTNVEKVKLEYSNDAGITWTNIADSISAQIAEYNWLIPNEAVSENAIIRVCDAIENSILDESNDVFRITNQQTITLIFPNGGERWIAGDTHLITWTSTNIENVKIEFSPDNGAHWTELAASIPAIQANYQWHTPTQRSVNYKVRISNALLPEVNAESNTFNITDPASITILNQFNNLEIIGGSTFEIKWSSVNVNNVKISYKRDAQLSSSQWRIIEQSTSSGAGSIIWEVPMMTSPNCKIRIEDVSFPGVFAESNIFSIKDFGIHLISPNGGEKLQAKSNIPITWKSKTGVSKVNIYYTIGTRRKYLVAQNVNASVGGFVWDVPLITTNNCRIIVTNSTNTSHSDTSDTPFSVIEHLEYKWKKINDFGNTFQMYFTSENKGFRIGYDFSSVPRLLQTTDGGFSWVSVESLRQEYAKDFSFCSNLVGFTITQSGKIYKTSDGGNTWVHISNSLYSSDDASYSFFSVSPSICYLSISQNIFSSMRMSNIIKTMDGGNTWIDLDIESYSDIKKLFFVNENLGWACKDDGRILKTTDNGNTWNEIEINQTESFNSIWFISPTHGFVCGDNYLGHTTDGGQTWLEDNVDSEFGTVNMKFKRLFFINDIGWATGDIFEPSDYYGPDEVYIGIIKTTNGGNNWEVDLKAGGNGSGPIFMLNPSLGWMNGSSTFKYGSSSLTVISPNGGEKIVKGENVNLNWYSEADLSDKVAISYRSKGSNSSETIFENISNTGSYTFSSSLLNCRECILKVSAANVSDETDSAFTIKLAFRSGYVEKDVPRNNSISAISISGANVYLNGNKTFKSSNKGNSWQEVLAENNISNFGKYFVDDQNVWLFENLNNTNSWKNRKSTNGGAFWQDVYSHTFESFGLTCGYVSLTYSPTITGIDYKLFKRNNNIAIIQNLSLLSKKCEQSGFYETNIVDKRYSGNALLISTDQGQTWFVNSLLTSNPELRDFDPFQKMKRRAFSFATNSIYYVVQGDAKLWRNVISQNPTSIKCLDLGEQKINAVYFVDYNKGYVVGDNGLIYKTISGGASWGQLNSNTTANLNAVYFPNAQTGYVVGNGVILKTTNGGTNWLVQESGLRTNLISVIFSDANEGWILGEDGIVLYTSTGGELIHIAKEAASIDELPKEYKLSQNFPNPFNPTTTISYSLPMNSRVKINIYNILGEVVAHLSDEIQTAGYHNKIWDANNIASGVYLLRIEAESLESNEKFVKSVKMLLVK